MKLQFLEIMVSTLFFLCLSSSIYSDEIPFYERKANVIINKVGNKLAKKYNMEIAGTGGGMIDCVKLMALSFNINKILNKNESRQLLLDCAAEFLKEINSNQEIRPYLVQFPFSVENIEIKIFIHDHEGRNVYDPNLSVISIVKGELRFRTNDKDNRYRFKSQYFESYDQALKLNLKMSQ